MPPDLRVEDFFEDKLRRKRPTAQTEVLLALSFLDGPLDAVSLWVHGKRACRCCGEVQPRGASEICRACDRPFTDRPEPRPTLEELLAAEEAFLAAQEAARTLETAPLRASDPGRRAVDVEPLSERGRSSVGIVAPVAAFAPVDVRDEDVWLGPAAAVPNAVEDEARVPWTSVGAGRGPLVLLSVLGVGALFLPWLSLARAEPVTLSGFEVATRTGLPWLVPAAWIAIASLVVTRRTVLQMQAARIAVAVLAAAPGIVSGFLVFGLDRAARARGLFGALRPVWLEGAYTTVALSVAAVAVSLLVFGGWVPLWERVRTEQR